MLHGLLDLRLHEYIILFGVLSSRLKLLNFSLLAFQDLVEHKCFLLEPLDTIL